MNVGVSGTITAQDVVRIERIEGELEELSGHAHELYMLAQNLFSTESTKMKRVIEAGAKAFASEKTSGTHELRKQMALLRAEMQREKWKTWLKDLEAATQKVVDCLAEIGARDTMSGLLDACPD
jgi:hypothetical protein